MYIYEYAASTHGLARQIVLALTLLQTQGGTYYKHHKAGIVRSFACHMTIACQALLANQIVSLLIQLGRIRFSSVFAFAGRRP